MSSRTLTRRCRKVRRLPRLIRACRNYGNPVYAKDLHSVIRTPTFLSEAASAGRSGDEQIAIVTVISSDPLAGDLMKGT